MVERALVMPEPGGPEVLSSDDAELAICVACGTQFADAAPDRCPICEDPRQYVPAAGQRWTTLRELAAAHHNVFVAQGELQGIVTEPPFAIGQRALLVSHGEGNILWDCVSLFDEDTATLVQRGGGLSGIAISHPHYYTTMVQWARRFDCPIHLHRDDAGWIMRPDRHIELWDGETLSLGGGLTLIRAGGHFPGATVLHRDRGIGTLLVGDVCLPVPDRDFVCFLWSYPNRVPLPADSVRRIAAALDGYEFQTAHAAFVDQEIRDAKRVIERSAARYVRALQTPGGVGITS